MSLPPGSITPPRVLIATAKLFRSRACSRSSPMSLRQRVKNKRSQASAFLKNAWPQSAENKVSPSSQHLVGEVRALRAASGKGPALRFRAARVGSCLGGPFSRVASTKSADSNRKKTVAQSRKNGRNLARPNQPSQSAFLTGDGRVRNLVVSGGPATGMPESCLCLG